MNLKTYIQAERGNATALAQALGIPASFLSQMASGDRAIAPERAARIEVLTEGKVRRWDLCPDKWHLIWPELVSVEGAPPVPREPATTEQGA